MKIPLRSIRPLVELIQSYSRLSPQLRETLNEHFLEETEMLETATCIFHKLGGKNYSRLKKAIAELNQAYCAEAHLGREAHCGECRDEDTLKRKL